MAKAASYIAHARTDGEDRLIEADEPLAGLQLRAGGEIPGTIASPALLELVRKARRLGLKLGQPIKARDENELVTAWVEVTPEGNEGGCAIGLSHWQAVEVPPDDAAAVRRAEIDRDLAELTARLDPQQRVLAASAAGAELEPLAERMREGLGRAWTDFVDVGREQSGRDPLHWRLLDGVAARVVGSSRQWRAALVPLGGPEPGAGGFELLLTSDQPPDTASASRRVEPGGPRQAAIGREIAPVLRQPIARIIANAETIRTQLAGPLADQYSVYAADIAAAGQHLLALIDDLSDLEVVESADFLTAFDRIDLADVARRAAGILGVRAQERAIRIAVPGDDEKMPAIGEFRRVMQVLLNLLGNAIRYAPEGSTVTLKLDRRKDRA
ncbi:MAG TPA: HAMP domain-containing sensor histidine kinase, partial [Croceibacterium sp.]|nr:HAMP domain-containing sensor histidine kinase [Croceibacterium sp.]